MKIYKKKRSLTTFQCISNVPTKEDDENMEVKRSLTTVHGTFNLPTEEDDTNME